MIIQHRQWDAHVTYGDVNVTIYDNRMETYIDVPLELLQLIVASAQSGPHLDDDGGVDDGRR